MEIRDNKDATKETWSLLPVLLLWMIKDRLDFVSNVRLAAVCRNWWSASSCYPKKLQSAGDGLPWIMQRSSSSDDDSSKEFICVSSREKFTMHLPDLCGAITLSSRQGWLLVLRRNFLAPSIPLPDSVFLFNPFTKAKIKMPELEDSFCQIVGCFSTHEGNPNCVALITYERRHERTLRVACPGDNMWTEHYDIATGLEFDGFCGSIIKGNLVCALDLTGRLLVYDMQSRSTKVLPRSNPICRCHMVELQGDIVKFEQRTTGIEDTSLLHIFRFNATEVVWQKLNIDGEDMKDISWFLINDHSCFSIKEKGLKIYYLQREKNKSGRRRSWREARVRNLVDGESSQMLFPYPLCISALWVDMG